MLIAAIVNYISDTGKTLFTSVGAVIVSQVVEPSGLDRINTGFQHTAWFVAIIAGCLTIVNLFFPLRTFYEERKKQKNEKYFNENE